MLVFSCVMQRVALHHCARALHALHDTMYTYVFMHAQRVIERITYARARFTQCYDLLVMYVIVLHPLDVM